MVDRDFIYNVGHQIFHAVPQFKKRITLVFKNIPAFALDFDFIFKIFRRRTKPLFTGKLFKLRNHGLFDFIHFGDLVRIPQLRSEIFAADQSCFLKNIFSPVSVGTRSRPSRVVSSGMILSFLVHFYSSAS